MVSCNRVGCVNTTVVDSTWSDIKLYGSSFVGLAIKKPNRYFVPHKEVKECCKSLLVKFMCCLSILVYVI